MAIATINPYTGETLKIFEPLQKMEIAAKLDLAGKAFQEYRQTSFLERSHWLEQAATILDQEKADLGKLMTLEMGKPLKAAIAEVEKCALVCRYYAENAASFLADVTIKTDASHSFVKYQPLGVILAVMPWNFPFWQVFRFAAPALMAGNVALLKHASNVPQCALAIEDIFHRAGFPGGVFQTLLIGADQVADLMADDRVKAATLTGSEPAGISLAVASGKQIKKTVLELGGSDPFIAAKRFIIAEAVADKFQKLLLEKFQSLKIGNPIDPDTDLGPLATSNILQELDQQVKKAVKSGGKILTGGHPLTEMSGNFYPPTIIIDVPVDTPIAQAEFFGPVALLFRVPDLNTAIKLANDTPFGLGASAWTTNTEEQNRLIQEIEAGAVFINSMVKSDPRLPFGGIKRSGYGRELSIQGLHEFVNIKTVWVK
jgi:succinate-semialdehyde dehydrogenase/glutarate-semialdehyde dehydrogenase